MSNTPRTDAAAFTVFVGKDNNGNSHVVSVVMADVAHQLERELNESHARETRLKSALADRATEIAGDQAFVNLFQETRQLLHESMCREAQLRAALTASDRLLVVEQDDWHHKAETQSLKNEQVLSLPPPPPVVPVEDVKPLLQLLKEVAELDTCEQECVASDCAKALATFTAKHTL